MIWITSISWLVFLGFVVWLSVWVSRLKNTELKLIREINDASIKLGVQQSLMYTTKNRLDTTMSQLEMLRIRHDNLLDKIQDGSVCDIDSIVAELRGVL